MYFKGVGWSRPFLDYIDFLQRRALYNDTVIYITILRPKYMDLKKKKKIIVYILKINIENIFR